MFNLEKLEAIIAERANESAAQSYTASLLEKGNEKCAQKLGEEAVEAVIEAVSENREGLTKEAADVLYHLLVVLKCADIPLAQVMAELEKRTSRSGHEEKASRSKGD